MKNALVIIIILAVCIYYAYELHENSKQAYHDPHEAAIGWGKLVADTPRIDTMTATISVGIPCKMDTFRGALIYHDDVEFSYGNVWDSGYVVALCGPQGYMPLDGFTFTPGIVHYHMLTQGQGDSVWHYEYENVPAGRFFTNEGKEIPAANVYGLIQLRK